MQRLKRKVSTLSLRFLPQWTNIEEILDGVPPTSLGFVRVHDFEHGVISLRR